MQMPLYVYEALSKQGVKRAGNIDAPSVDVAKELLRAQSLFPVKVREASDNKQSSFLVVLFEKKVDPKTVIVFTKQFAVLLRSGVPLLQSLELLVEQFDGAFRRVLVNVKDGIKSGKSLAVMLGNYPRIFSHVYVQLVMAGEATGKLDTILERLSGHLIKDQQTKERISKAMQNPIIMLVLAVLVIAGMLTFLVPKLEQMFSKFGKELPGPTQFLIDVSHFVTSHYLSLVAFCIIFFVTIKYLKSTPQGAYRIDALLLKLGPTAYFSRTKAVVQFSKTLGMLLDSGVNLAEALDIVTNIVENKVLTQQLRTARDNIIKEGKIAKYLTQTGIFPKIAAYMISTGEESGKLADMLLMVGDDYDHELTELIDGLVEKINPIMTVVMGLIVGFMVVSIFLPIVSMNDMAGM